jgi:hypothetical protein
MYLYLSGWIGAGVLLLTISIFGLIYLLKNRDDKAFLVIGLILIIGVIVGTIILVGNTVSDAIYDVKKHAYIMVEGEFEVVDDEKTPSRACSIILPDGTRLDTNVYVMEDGKYSGYVVYAEKTKKVLHVEVSNDN